MPPKVNKPLRLAWYGIPKIGKSHLAAQFVKEFDGLYIDFAKVNQISPMSKGGPSPVYDVAGNGPINSGDAYTAAAEHVGVKPQQYMFIRSWDEFMMAIEVAKSYRDESTKKNKRIWIVIDDTTNFRWQCALWCLEQTGHKSLATSDWAMCTMALSSAFQTLESNFNTIYVNQVKELYVNDQATGEYVGAFYPANMEHIVDATLEYTYGEDENGEYPMLKIKSLKNKWRFERKATEQIPKSIEFKNPETLSPSMILEALKFDKELW